MFFSSQGEVREGASQKREVALDSRCSPQKNVCNLFLLTKLCYVSLCLLIYPYASATHAPPFLFLRSFLSPPRPLCRTYLPACVHADGQDQHVKEARCDWQSADSTRIIGQHIRYV